MNLIGRVLLIGLSCFSICTYLLVPRQHQTKETIDFKAKIVSFLPSSLGSLETKMKEVHTYLANRLENLQSRKEVISSWVNLGNGLLENLSTLNLLPLLFSENGEMLQSFFSSMQDLEGMIQEKSLHEKTLLQSVLSYSDVKKLQMLTGKERYTLLELCSKFYNVSDNAKEKNALLILQNTIKCFEVTPYEYKQGELASSTRSKNLKILTLNTCFMPGGLSYFFGGMRAWQDRLEGVSEKLIGEQADVICLQEVHSEASAEALFQKLKGHYAHFYFNMGSKVLGTSLRDLGLNSGLFIASKYAIQNPHFQTFITEGHQEDVNKGFFYGVLADSKGAFAEVITCHLEPFNATLCASIREKELLEILDYLYTEKTARVGPLVLVGDLNIPAGAFEPGQYVLEENFYDGFSPLKQTITSEDRTCTDYFTNSVKALTQGVIQNDLGSNEILDYALLLKEGIPYSISAKRVIFFDTEKPYEALSDHNGLLAEIAL